MIRKVSAIKSKSFKSQLKKIIEKHGEAVVFFTHYDGLRKRVIAKNGDCKVCYKGTEYKKWSRLEESCFMSYIRDQQTPDYDHGWGWSNRYRTKTIKGKKKTLTNTIKALVKHDKDERVLALQIQYGKGIKRETLIVVNI